MTATRGCRAEVVAWPASVLLVGVCAAEEAGEGGTMVEAGDEVATSLSGAPDGPRVEGDEEGK